jgi:protein-L-isoaspartate(D-aspartate) O-methyltransferase
MVELQIAARGVRDRQVLDAMRRIPREAFVPDALQEFAYEDSPLPIEAAQTISQPYIVALMIEAAGVRRGQRVLEIGAGSGYAAAVMAAIAERVYAIERLPQLVELARERFRRLALGNIELKLADGTGGWPEAAPFDAIIAAAGGPSVPELLRQQLKIGGRLVMPIGDMPDRQRLIKLTRASEDRFDEEDLGGVLFVPLIGRYGWKEPPDHQEAPRHDDAASTPTDSIASAIRADATVPISAALSIASQARAWSCSAKPATAHPSSIAHAPRSPAI